ncbi:GxxExxY protein [Geobacter pickeringii]|uniref:GxxExxY protein n=1 Tax=Geobacter pickeringii TaxID=345632 RepID=A0A0B5BE57_9BACT|nr:GxxExxY protein [Geobacter pickeringii]
MCHRGTKTRRKAINAITDKIIGCAIEVHRNLGPGLLESIYEKALCHELGSRGLHYENQAVVPIVYKGSKLGEHRIDLLVENRVIVELKATERLEPVFKAQLLSYLKLTEKKVGLLINFNVPVLRDGVTRVVL